MELTTGPCRAVRARPNHAMPPAGWLVLALLLPVRSVVVNAGQGPSGGPLGPSSTPGWSAERASTARLGARQRRNSGASCFRNPKGCRRRRHHAEKKSRTNSDDACRQQEGPCSGRPLGIGRAVRGRRRRVGVPARQRSGQADPPRLGPWCRPPRCLGVPRAVRASDPARFTGPASRERAGPSSGRARACAASGGRGGAGAARRWRPTRAPGLGRGRPAR